MLRVESLSVAYGGLKALDGVTLDVGAGGFVSLVGPNGAGKSTLFKAISGTVAPLAGSITFDGRDLLAMRPCDRPRLGIAHVPEGRQMFKTMSVLENIEMGRLAGPLAGRAAGRAAGRSAAAEWRRTLDRILALFPDLAARRGQLAGTLSGGQQQMVAIARGLAASPRLIMLDEPSMGLSPLMAETIFDAIAAIHRAGGIAVLLVEQRVAEAVEGADRSYVLEMGRVAAEGTPDGLLQSDCVKRAYLGL